MILPYNGSIFQLRGKYRHVFHDLVKDPPEADTKGVKKSDNLNQSEKQLAQEQIVPNQKQNKKVYKIKYILNLLPGVNYGDEEDMMEILSETDELGIFRTKVVYDLVEFKWNAYGKNVHYLGAFLHLCYNVVFFIYVNEVYIGRNFNAQYNLCWAMLILLIYPMVYDMLQLCKQGPVEYFGEFWNYLDQFHIWFGLANIIVQRTTENIVTKVPQVLMILVALMLMIKSFFFLRIFKELSFLVTMLKQVFLDLRVFMLFYGLLIFMFAIVLSILDLGNFTKSSDPNIRNLLNGITYPGKEYMHINHFMGNFFTVLRISMGDFQFDAQQVLDPFQSSLFWLLWLIVVTMTCIVFLNFIIAEVSASYQAVKDQVDVIVLQERAQLINEAEDMLKARFGQRMMNWTHIFPKYIISRQQDE